MAASARAAVASARAAAASSSASMMCFCSAPELRRVKRTSRRTSSACLALAPAFASSISSLDRIERRALIQTGLKPEEG